MLLKAVAVWEEAGRPGTPLVAMVIMAVLEGKRSRPEAYVTDPPEVLAIVVIDDEELATLPHLRPQTSRHCDWNVLRFINLGGGTSREAAWRETCIT